MKQAKLFELEVGDRFYRLTDYKKTVLEVAEKVVASSRFPKIRRIRCTNGKTYLDCPVIYLRNIND